VYKCAVNLITNPNPIYSDPFTKQYVAFGCMSNVSEMLAASMFKAE
jgi:hypothetical protein